MTQKKRDPEGRFYLLVLTDGERTDGIEFTAINCRFAHFGNGQIFLGWDHDYLGLG
jgi:hypothetical protein